MEDTITKQRWLNAKQAATYLGCSEDFLNLDRINKRAIPFSRLGRHVRYLTDDLDTFMMSTRMQAAPPLKKKAKPPAEAAVQAEPPAVQAEPPAEAAVQADTDEANPSEAAVEQRRKKPLPGETRKRRGRRPGSENKTLQRKEVTV